MHLLLLVPNHYDIQQIERVWSSPSTFGERSSVSSIPQWWPQQKLDFWWVETKQRWLPIPMIVGHIHWYPIIVVGWNNSDDVPILVGCVCVCHHRWWLNCQQENTMDQCLDLFQSDIFRCWPNSNDTNESQIHFLQPFLVDSEIAQSKWQVQVLYLTVGHTYRLVVTRFPWYAWSHWPCKFISLYIFFLMFVSTNCIIRWSLCNVGYDHLRISDKKNTDQ